MASLNVSELLKRTYKSTLISKLKSGTPITLEEKDSSGNRMMTVLTIDKDVLNAIDVAKTEEELNSVLKDGKTFKKIFKTQDKKLIPLSLISKESVKDSTSRVGDANTTVMQELCSLKVFENLLEHNRSTELSELVSIYPGVAQDKSWQDSFKAQEVVFKRIIKKYNLSKMKHYNHTGGFMDFITKKVKELGISKKDSWNPADIWLVKDDNVMSELKQTNTIFEINNEMIKLFNEKRLIGISLKKTGKTADFEETNISKGNQTIYPFKNGSVLLSIQNGKFSNDELSYDQEYYSNSIINTQVRMYPKKSKSNVQVSCKLKGGSAEFGKVPSSFRNSTFSDVGGKFPVGSNMPMSLSAFEKEEKDWAKMVQTIINKKRFNTGIKNAQEFSSNVKEVFSSQNAQYHQIELCSKFQGIAIAYYMSIIPKNTLDDLLTKWAYLAQKKGDLFGPFIKVH